MSSIERNGNGQHVQTPPHPDEMERVHLTELQAVLERQARMQDQRMQEFLNSNNELNDYLVATAVKADNILRVYTNTLVRVRQLTDENNRVLEDLKREHREMGIEVHPVLSKTTRQQ